jgi:predicted GNAT family acetyltransferase
VPKVINDPDRSVYEILTDEGETAGYSAYRLEDDRVVFLHTELEMEFEGRGLGSALVRGALEDVRARGLKVVPRCPFVREYLERHLEYDGLRA